MLKVKYRSQFKKDYKRALKRGLDPEALRIVLDKLINNETLDAKYRDHQLKTFENVTSSLTGC
jgi:mRNA interferase YafQ